MKMAFLLDSSTFNSVHVVRAFRALVKFSRAIIGYRACTHFREQPGMVDF